MPNLDNIHFKFFPKAKTAPYGKTLIKFAWTIEIIVATVGLTIAAFLYMRALVGSEDVSMATTWTEKLTENIDGVIVSLAFVVVLMSSEPSNARIYKKAAIVNPTVATIISIVQANLINVFP